MTDFHKTPIGQLFYGKHVPELVKELRRVADSLELGNKMMVKESKLTKKSIREKLDKKIDNVDELDKLEEKTSNLNQGGHAQKDPDLSAIDE